MSSDPPRPDDAIPTLTDVVELDTEASAAAFEELRTELAERVMALTEELVRDAARELEDELVARIAERLREELPTLIDAALRDRITQSE
jgi:hypothetical protein